MSEFVVEVVVGGRRHTANCAVDGHWLTVRYEFGAKCEAIGGMRSQLQLFAEILLKEMIPRDAVRS